MDAKNNHLHMFRKNLDGDKDLKELYVSAEADDTDSSSYSEGEEMKIVLPRRKNKNVDTSQELLFQLIKKQQDLSIAQKKLYKVKSELESIEITSRYVKLDLNNAQIKIDETVTKLKDCRESLVKSKNENNVFRFICIIWFIYRVYLMVSYVFI